MSDTQNDFSNDEFEKVEAAEDMMVPDQEGVVSSSSPADMAEADRYNQDTDAFSGFGEPAGMNVGGFGTDEPLMSFGEPGPIPETTVTESTPPPVVTETSKFEKLAPQTEPSAPAEGNWMKNVDPRVLELIYWRDVKKTGVVFGSMMFVLLSLSCCSLLSVLAYLSLAILTVTFSFRVYKNVMQAVQKTNEGHPFKKLMDMEIELREDVVQNAAEKIAANINNCSRELRRLYLVGDYIDSLKFGLMLWLLTYIGAWFNGMTLVILAVVHIFTLPKLYETYQGPIDQNLNMVRAQWNNIMQQVSAKIPFPKKKVKAQ